MKEIRIHARAGQGAITTATILGHAYFIEGKFPYAFPSFGAARMGAPMNAFVRVDTKPVRLRSQVYEPDFLIIADPTLMRGFNCFSGFKPQGIAVINEKDEHTIKEVVSGQKAFFVPASDIAMATIGRPIANTALLGAFAAASGEFKLESLIEAIKKRFSEKLAAVNILAAQKGFEYISKATTYGA
ncbi:MAG: 2-oxoacid:acceptor oxidoreductase family protein [Candidatus Omnitrophota bacterium]